MKRTIAELIANEEKRIARTMVRLTSEEPLAEWTSEPVYPLSMGAIAFGRTSSTVEAGHISLGYGIMADAHDFPPGTRIKITLEAIPPALPLPTDV